MSVFKICAENVCKKTRFPGSLHNALNTEKIGLTPYHSFFGFWRVQNLGVFSVIIVMVKEDNKKTPKNPSFFCECCNFISGNKKDYTKHLSTAKHQKNAEWYINDNKKTLLPLTIHECNCGRKYKFSSGLSRHKKKCDLESLESDEKSPVSVFSNEIVCKLLEDLSNSQKQVVELLKEKNMQVATTNNNNTTTNSNNITNNNTQININMFLNENCKNAVTMNEFIKSIQPTLEDVIYMSKHGNKQGISRIITTALGQLEVTERPMHCTDLKRHTTYIKESDGWTKDHDNSHIDKMCKTAQHGCLLKIGEALKTDPNYSMKGTSEYENQVTMMSEAAKETDGVFLTTVLENKVYLSKDKIRNI
jgi:hypothetical protein